MTEAEPFYPINNDRNTSLYDRYKALADATPGVIFGGRLAEYRYYDIKTYHSPCTRPPALTRHKQKLKSEPHKIQYFTYFKYQF